MALGHEVIAREIEVEDVGNVTARERPDVALVGLGESSEHALELIDKIVREAACPVIALLHAPDPDFVREASKRGVFAHISDDDVEDWQSSIDIVLRRFTECHDIEGAFERRALTERAKGILWNATPSTKTPRSKCSAPDRAATTANSSTSPPPSSTATAYSPNTKTLQQTRDMLAMANSAAVNCERMSPSSGPAFELWPRLSQGARDHQNGREK